ncbi:hypothetical protein [Christiangramia sp. SM2212]|uniref:Carboxypeptidase-like regulatory domain-containing protein n=1 Tax=Christiangramia sediminicola TaxID=3073267 RepID=A0ABU1ERI9_9FLAO|nr:hypothetical protein [Christiangramia sp. SM2212]MDR5591010.1 hypothetical protein [Christiangramia sp. SM2212]
MENYFQKIILIIILSLNQSISAQEVKGIIYDSNGAVPDFEVLNKTRNSYAKTNEQGFFSINSKLGDTLVFNTLVYQKQTLIVKEINLKETIVVELKTAVNALDQVNISSSTNEFRIEKANQEIERKIISDKEKNWFLYEIPESKGNIYDGLVSVINSVFPKKPEIRIIELNDYQELFSSDENLNYDYLQETLNIPEHQYNLFFDYLESKSLNYDLLRKANRLDLIEKINHLSAEFKIMLQSSE